MIRALFYRGRHHLHASLLARPFDERPRVTVAAIAERLRREARQRREALGTASVVIEPDVHQFDAGVRRALLGLFSNPEQFAPEQLGAMSV